MSKKEESAAVEAVEETGSKKWYKSTTIQGMIGAVIVLVVLPRIGVELPQEYLTEIYTAVAGWIVFGLRKSTGGISL